MSCSSRPCWALEATWLGVGYSALTRRPSGLGRADAILFRPFGPLAIQPLGQLGPVRLNGSRLRFGLLALVIKRLEFIASRGNLGLDLGQLSNCLLLLLALGQKLILTGFQVGQLGPEIRERPPANQGQRAQNKA